MLHGLITGLGWEDGWFGDYDVGRGETQVA